MKKTRALVGLLTLITSLFLASPTYAATLSLSPSTGSIGKGCSFSVDILIDTKSVDSDSSDVILTFDPAQFSASSIINGTIFTDYPGNSIDNQTGKVSIYALSSVQSGQPATSFNGQGVLATVNFTASNTSALTTQPINFDFDQSNPTKTTDSNVIQQGTTSDILTAVTNGTYTVGGSSCSGLSAAGQGQTESSGSAVNSLPSSGTFSTTLVVLAAGILMTLVGLVGLSYNKQSFSASKRQ